MIIKIKELKTKTIIGVFDWEKNQEREVIISLELEVDNNCGSDSDNIADTIDYDTLSKKIIEETAKSRFNLIEKLAKHLIDIIMQDKRIKHARIEIDKPGAVKEAKSVSVVYEL